MSDTEIETPRVTVFRDFFRSLVNAKLVDDATLQADCPNCGKSAALTCEASDSGGIQWLKCSEGCRPGLIPGQIGKTCSELGIDPQSGRAAVKSTATHGRKNAPRLDVEEVRHAAEGRWLDILSYHGANRDDLDGRHHACPKCGGTDRFRCIDESAGALMCNQCFATNNGDGFAALMWLNNWTFPQSVEAVASQLNIGRRHDQPNDRSNIVEATARMKRVPLPSWLAFGAREDNRGNLLVARLPMYDAFGNQCSYCDFAEISPEFIKGMSAKGKPTGLYYAERPQPGDTIYICEGPKDAAALHSLGFKAAGMPTCKLSKKLARAFAGCSVIIVPDLDKTGIESAQITAGRLYGIAKSVRIARLPGEVVAKDGDGVREILAQSDGESLVRQALEDAQAWLPEAGGDEPPADDTQEWTSIISSRGRTDLANSRRFKEAHGENVRFCFPWGKFLIWDGARWDQDATGAPQRLAATVADSIWMEARDHINKEIADFAVKSSGSGGISSMLKLAAAHLPISVSEMDANPWLLNCRNCTVDLRLGTGRQHRREDSLTKLCPTAFNPDAGSYHWDRFLDSVFDGDDLVISFLRRLCGYFLTGDVSEQILAVFHGGGSNGKSTFLTALQNTLGQDYTAPAPTGLLMEKKSEAHPTELAGLFGKRLIVAQETNAGSRLAESTVKQLTGGDLISARRMREDFWSFSPTHKLVICSNHKPRVKGTDHAIWRRLVLIPFERKFWNPAKGETGPEELRQDKDLQTKLTAESEGILAWMVRGCLEWQKNGLQIPDSVRAATNEYRSEQDVLGRFVADCCLTGNSYRVRFGDFYERFEAWCNDSGDNAPSRKFTGEWLKESGFRDKHSTVRWYLGIALRAEMQCSEQ